MISYSHCAGGKYTLGGWLTGAIKSSFCSARISSGHKSLARTIHMAHQPQGEEVQSSHVSVRRNTYFMNSTDGLTLLLEEEQGIFLVGKQILYLCVCACTHDHSLEAILWVQIKFRQEELNSFTTIRVPSTEH